MTRAFVDSIEEDVARLVIGQATARLPASILPDGVTEGSWIELRVKALPDASARSTADKTRAGDPHDDGDLKL